MRIPTFGDILMGKIPREEDFNLAQKTVVNTISRSPATLAACQLGSSLRQEHNRLSDIDVLWIIDTSKLADARQAFRRIHTICNKLHITVEIIMIPAEVSETDAHSIRPCFWQTLDLSEPRGVIRAAPSSILVKSYMTTRDDVASRIARKLEKRVCDATRYDTMTHEEMCEFLGKLIALPSHIARTLNFHFFSFKPSMVKNKSDQIGGTLTETDESRYGSIRLFLSSSWCSLSSQGAMDELIQAFTSYNKLLDKTIENLANIRQEKNVGLISKKQYSDLIKKVRSTYIGEVAKLADTCTNPAILLLQESLQTAIKHRK